MSTYESRVEITDSYCGFVYFLLLFYQCLVHVLWHHIIRFVIYSWWLEHFTIMNRSLSTVIFSLKSSSDINITIPTLFWFALKWCNFPFFHSYIFVTVLKFSLVAAPFCIPTDKAQGSQFLLILINTCPLFLYDFVYLQVSYLEVPNISKIIEPRSEVAVAGGRG